MGHLGMEGWEGPRPRYLLHHSPLDGNGDVRMSNHSGAHKDVGTMQMQPAANQTLV